MMVIYGFHLLDFTPNAMACMAIFTHLCENFVRVAPNIDLFRNYFVPWVVDKSQCSRNISWMPRVSRVLDLRFCNPLRGSSSGVRAKNSTSLVCLLANLTA